MKGEWSYFTNSPFTPEICNTIIQKFKKHTLKPAQIGFGASARIDPNFRKSRTCIIEKDDTEFEELFPVIWDMAMEMNNIWFDFDIRKISYIQFTEYDSSYKGEFKPHTDIFWMNGDPKFHRKLTLVIQLSDPSTYKGGSLEFTRLSGPEPNEIQKEQMKQQGTAILFPSFIEHGVTPVTEGIRYSLCCCIEGPKFR